MSDDIKTLLEKRERARADRLPGRVLELDLEIASRVPALLDRVEALTAERDARAAIAAADQWLPIESAPKDGTAVLVWSHGHGRYISSYEKDDDGGGAWEVYLGGETYHVSYAEQPTRWRPLPEPPSEQSSDAH